MNGNRKFGSNSTFTDSILRTSAQYGTGITFLVMALISILLGGLLYFYLLSPWAEANNLYREQVNKKEIDNLKTEKMLAGEEQFQIEYKKIVGLYDQAKPLLPEETEISDVLGQVEEAAKRNGVTLTGLAAVKESVKSPRAARLFEREIPALVTGPYPQVVRFFTDVSRMPRILVVRDYSIVSLKNAVSAGFTLIAFHAAPGEAPGTTVNQQQRAEGRK